MKDAEDRHFVALGVNFVDDHVRNLPHNPLARSDCASPSSGMRKVAQQLGRIADACGDASRSFRAALVADVYLKGQ
jgi:hypothetical protein